MSILDKMSFSSGRPELPKKPQSSHPEPVKKFTPPQDRSVFGGKPWVLKKPLVKSFDTSLKREIKRELHLTGQGKKVDQEIERLQGKIEGHAGNVITRRDARDIIKDSRHEDALDTKEKSKDGFTDKELVEMKKNRNATKFLEKKFGLKP